MESDEDLNPEVLLPLPNDRAARAAYSKGAVDREYMKAAVAEARKCISESGVRPKVGAVAVTRDGAVVAGYRGECGPGDHAEYTVLERKCEASTLAGGTIYTTLEPCTTRNPPKRPCVKRLIERRVGRVVVGMLDPDERIRGRGVLALREAGVQVDLFPPDLMRDLEEMNREFIHDRSPKESHSLFEGAISIFKKAGGRFR